MSNNIIKYKQFTIHEIANSKPTVYFCKMGNITFGRGPGQKMIFFSLRAAKDFLDMAARTM